MYHLLNAKTQRAEIGVAWMTGGVLVPLEPLLIAGYFYRASVSFSVESRNGLSCKKEESQNYPQT